MEGKQDNETSAIVPGIYGCATRHEIPECSGADCLRDNGNRTNLATSDYFIYQPETIQTQ